MKKLGALIFLTTFANVVIAQKKTGSVSGVVYDASAGRALEYAAITVKSSSDSSKVYGAMSGSEGDFKIGGLPLGNYRVQISFIGYNVYRSTFIISEDKPLQDFGKIKLEAGSISLKEVAVQGEKLAVSVKKDTLEFNASSFKTRPDATTEELLKKLPGVQVDKDGNITVAGQKVERLTVDGKDFFGTDPKTATQNLPADAIEKVQIVDSKTQDAKATGIDDGQREKVLNLTIKKDKKKGWFGNATASGGDKERYNGYLSANRFQNDKQLAILAMSNNVNAANFSFQDLQSFSGGNLGSIFAPPAGGSFNINVDGKGNTTIGGSGIFENAGRGLVNTHAGGVNYSNAFGKRKNLKFTGSYFTYFSDSRQDKFSNLQDLGTADVLTTDEAATILTDNQAHRLNMRVEYNPDSLTDITFRPNVILNNTVTSNIRNFNSRYEKGGGENSGLQSFDQESSTPALFGEFAILRRLGPDKGSVSFRLNATYSEVNTDWNNIYSLNRQDSTVAEDFNQQSEQGTNARGYTLNGNYVRPFNKKWNSNISYQYTESNSLANQVTYDYNPISGRYETVVADLTNAFDYKNWNQSARLGFNFNNKAWSTNFGVALQQSGLNGSTQKNDGGVIGLTKDYWNILPRAGFTFKPKNNRSINLNYGLNVFMPAISNLQPVQNNSNPLYQREGNPDLVPTKTHRVTLNYNTFKPGTDLYWNGYFAYNYLFDAVSSDTKVNEGIQTVKPVNVDGNYSINTGTNFGFPASIKGLRFSFGAYLFLSHNKNFINSAANTTDRSGFGPYGGINYDIDEKLNLSFSGEFGWNKVDNRLQAAANQRYRNFSSTLNLSYEFVKDLRLEAELNQNGFEGRGEGFDRSFYLLNAGLVKYFMNRKVNLALRGFDILKQNININRSVTNTRIEDVRYNNLTRYFYLSLTYRLAKVGATGEREHPRSTVN